MATQPLPRRKTKIVATLGPASSSAEIIRKLIQSGVNVFRMNFSHGSHESHSQTLKNIREQAAALNSYIAVLQDLGGPKVRIGDVLGGQIELEDGASIALRHGKGKEGDNSSLYVEAFDPVAVLRPGEKALLADGRIVLIADKVQQDHVVCSIKAGGSLRSRSGIAVPESKLELPCLTDKDRTDLEWGIQNNVDYVALSFVGSARDIHELQGILKKRNSSIRVIAKIERAKSLEQLNEIVESSDAVMVARGDLGLELPLERVPHVQQLIIQTANFRGTPVITATQMLQSMVTEVRPTRAEVSDVYSAVRDGTDAVMLSEETAVGKHPVEAVQVLDSILQESEKEYLFSFSKPKLKNVDSEAVPDAICYAAVNAADKISASAVVACTVSGHTAQLISKYRPHQMLFGGTANTSTLARMALYWGVVPMVIGTAEATSTEEEIMLSLRALRDTFGLKPGSRVVLTAGLRANKTGTTTLMEIREIPRG